MLTGKNKAVGSLSVLLVIVITLFHSVPTIVKFTEQEKRVLLPANDARWTNATAAVFSSSVPQINKTDIPASISENVTVQTTDTKVGYISGSIVHNKSSATEESPVLWIHVVAWGEGLTAWRHTFVDVVILAMKMNATVVEPCVVNGRLKSCAGIPDLSRAIRFHQILNMDHILSLYPHIVSYEEFQQKTGYTTRTKYDNAKANNVFHACLTSEGKEMQKQYATSLCGKLGVKNTAGSSKQSAFDQAVRASQHSTTILEILGLWIHKLDVWVPEGRRRGDLLAETERDATLKAEMTDSLRFADEQFDQVQRMLQEFNISVGTPFAAIQWRPEVIEDLDYLACANSLLKSRDVISERDGIPVENFILMSSFSKRKELQWGGVAKLAALHNETSSQSLDLLLDSGFHKLEQTFGEEDVADGTFLAVWDFILAMTANSFTTCAKDICSDQELCSACNHRGKSSVYALDMREAYQANNRTTTHTHDCWPT